MVSGADSATEGKRNSFALVFSDEIVVLVVGQIVARQDRVVVGYGDPPGVHGPVVPPAQTETVPDIVSAV